MGDSESKATGLDNPGGELVFTLKQEKTKSILCLWRKRGKGKRSLQKMKQKDGLPKNRSTAKGLLKMVDNVNKKGQGFRRVGKVMLACMLMMTMVPGQAAFAQTLKEGLEISASNTQTETKSLPDEADKTTSDSDASLPVEAEEPAVKEKITPEAEEISAVSLATPLSPEPRAGGEEFQFEVTVGANETFYVPTSGRLQDQENKQYNWHIVWSDGASGTYSDQTNSDGNSASPNTSDANGILHTYVEAKTYTISITPNGSKDAWLGVFGFSSGTSGAANQQGNRNKLKKVVSPITSLMTRTQTAIDNPTTTTPPSYEWAYTFINCQNLLMDDAFNLPQDIQVVGGYFASAMFKGCSSLVLPTNFNLPQGIKSVGRNFASSMFWGCTATTMSENFNFPAGITSVGDYFAASMFRDCSALTMGGNFNIPREIATVGQGFLQSTFENCSGENFQVNSIFTFPTLSEADLIKPFVFSNTFAGLNTIKQQDREAASIISSTGKDPLTYYPESSARATFGAAFPDIAYIHSNWGGGGQRRESFQLQVEVGDSDKTFALPTSGYLNGWDKSYNWSIKWGDGAIQTTNSNEPTASPNTIGAEGISHTYEIAGTYTITIVQANNTPDAWLGAFGFFGSAIEGANDFNREGANSPTNRNKVVGVLSPITLLMTRTATQISNPTGAQPTYEWYSTFQDCTNLTLEPGFTFDGNVWVDAKKAGDGFAARMFAGCSGNNFTIAGSNFNLPQDLVEVGENFAAGMFKDCSGKDFAMSDYFDLPVNIKKVNSGFASEMFSGCSGENFTMNGPFSLPGDIRDSVGDDFASGMFLNCNGNVFTMNNNFALPRAITSAGTNFANAMFEGCSGATFSMNGSVFRVPQTFSSIQKGFMARMFYKCSGANFKVNSSFTFPTFLPELLDQEDVFKEVFAGVCPQDPARTAAFIINSPSGSNPMDYRPATERATFDTAFADIGDIHSNWGGFYTLEYHLQGGSVIPALTKVKNLTKDQVYTLAGKDIYTFTHLQQGGIDVVFAGWSTTLDATIYTKDSLTAPDLLLDNKITIEDNTDIYAIWGLDSNKDGQADINEAKYVLTYNVNGGVGDNKTETVVKGTYALDSSFKPAHTKQGDTEVVLAGWTLSADNTIYTKDSIFRPNTLVENKVAISGNTNIYAVWGLDTNGDSIADINQTFRKVTQHYVDRTGVSLKDTSSVVVVDGASYVGGSAPALSGYIYGGAAYSAPSASSPSTVTGGVLPTCALVSSDTEVWYVYGSDADGNGTEDVQITRQWVFISGGAYVNIPGAPKDIETFNSGDTFALDQTGAPAPTIPSSFTYKGYLTDQDALTAAPQTGAPSILVTIADGNRTISYVYETSSYWVAYHVVDKHNNLILSITAPEAEIDKAGGDTYGLASAPSGVSQGKVYLGWKEGIAGTLKTSAIAGTVAGSMDIYLVYGTDTNRDGKEDVDVTRHALGTDGTALTTKHDPITKTVNLENSPYTENQAGVTQNGWSYVGWNTTGSTTTYASGNPDIALAADTNVDVYYLYERVSHTITEHYVDRFGKQIKPDTTLTKTYGESYTGAAAPVITGYLYAGSASSAPTQALPSLVSGKALPTVPTITQDTSVWYVYGTDRVTNSGNSGADGVEDLEVQCKWVDADGNNIAVSLPQKSVYVDIARVFELAYASGVTIPAGWDYVGYKLNGGALNKLALPTPRSNPSFPIELATPLVKTVEYVFARSLCPVTVTHVDTQGNSIGSQDETVTVSYGDNFVQDAPSIAGYTYSHWVLDGALQDASQISLTNVTSAHAIQLVYKATVNPDPDPTPTPDNSDFMKRPHSKNVSAGETLGYTFSGFGNAWGFDLEHFTLTDKPDKGLDFVSANLPAFTNGKGVAYNVAYATNQSGKRMLHSNVSAAQAFSFQAPTLDAGEYITAVTLEFGTVPSGFAVGDTFTLYFRVWDTPPAQTLTNTGILSYKAGDEYKEFVSGGNGDGSTAITIGGWFVQVGDAATTLPWVIFVIISAVFLVAGFSRKRFKTREHEGARH